MVESNSTQDCKNAYTVTVEEQYDVETPFNSTHSTRAPSIGDRMTIYTSPQNCPACPKLEDKKTYLIAGSYSRADDGSIVWTLDGTNDKALLSEWTSKYSRKLAGWIETTNSRRQLFLQQCESDSKLVSPDQWRSH